MSISPGQSGAKTGCDPAQKSENPRHGEPAGILTSGAPALCAPRMGCSDSSDPTARVVTSRRFRPLRARSTIFRRWARDAGEQLGQLGDGAGVERIFLVGERPGQTIAGVREWATAELPAGWSHSERGHYMEGDSPVLRYQHESGATVELHRSASWFGDSTDVDRCREAWVLLGHLMRRAFGLPALLATPTTTGREAWLRTIPEGREWLVLPSEVQELIRSTSGQGRIELVAEPGAELPALVEMDARWAYSALCRQLAGVAADEGATWELVAGAPFDPYARARWHVRGEVPRDWSHVGILPVKDESGGWRWPRRPGERFDTWADGAELLVAQRHGWHFSVVEALTFPTYRGAGPLDQWSKKLRELRETARNLAAVGARDEGVVELVGHAIRAMLLHAIGGFHGTPHRVTRAVPIDEPEKVPAGVHFRLEGSVLAWAEVRPPAWPEMVHPEWSAAIWARARARLVDAPDGAGALHVPFSEVVGFRTDAVYLTAPASWPDDGKAGRYRVKSHVLGPLRAPANQLELLALRDGGEG